VKSRHPNRADTINVMDVDPAATPARVNRGPTLGTLGMVLALGAIIGFAVGSRLAAGDQARPAPSSTVAAADVLPDSVSQRLRDAYYAGGGSVAACVAAQSVVCTRARAGQSPRSYADVSASIAPGDLESLTAAEVDAGRIIVAGDFGPVGGAAVARIDGGVASAGRLLVVVYPDRQGIDYVDLGTLEAGRYLVSIGVPTLQMPTVLIEIVLR
jgi:hypothetical protein